MNFQKMKKIKQKYKQICLKVVIWIGAHLNDDFSRENHSVQLFDLVGGKIVAWQDHVQTDPRVWFNIRVIKN